MDDQVAMYSKESQQKMIADLRRFFASAGALGVVPSWYSQLRAAQLVFCPPWDLDAEFGNSNQAGKLLWIQRAGIVEEAKRQASDVLNRRTRAR